MNVSWPDIQILRDPVIAAMIFFAAWFSLFIYAWTVVRLVYEGEHATPLPRFLWSLGCFFMLVHWICAFEIFYDWSHAEAYERTRRRTDALTGFDTGAGLYVNYVFTLLWVADLVWWWIVGNERYRKRSRWISGLWHGFFLFMLFNSGVYFVDDWKRWMGLGLFLVSLVAVVMLIRQRPANVSPAPAS